MKRLHRCRPILLPRIRTIHRIHRVLRLSLPLILLLLAHETLPTPPCLLNALLTLQHLICLQSSKHPTPKEFRRSFWQRPPRTLTLRGRRKSLQCHLSTLTLLPLRLRRLYRGIPGQLRLRRLLPSHSHTRCFLWRFRTCFDLKIGAPIDGSKVVGC